MRKPVLLTGTAFALLLAAPAFSGTALAASACSPTDPVVSPVVSGVEAVTTAYTTAGPSCFVVPPYVTSVVVHAVGGRGGDVVVSAGDAVVSGGRGGDIVTTIAVTPGQQIPFAVGVNGGSDFAMSGGSGGTSSSFADLLIAAGGGGAGGRNAWGEDGGPGGDAGSAGADAPADNNASQEGHGGGGGTATTGGLGGAGGGGTSPGHVGLDGTAGSGGTGSEGGYYGWPIGGGGGGGLFGGGGGGGGGLTDPWYSGADFGGAGGGGGGSNFVDASLTALVTTATDATPEIEITIPDLTTVAYSPSAGVSFAATQPLQTVSPSQVATITNDGSAPVSVGGLEIGGDNADDFIISGDTCRASLAPAATCKVTIRFTPQATGPRAGTLEISGNASASIPLSGTGGLLPKGDQGDQGDLGATGANGTNGDPGAAGANGTNGASGAAGSKGATGADGTNGSNGTSGAPGTNGTDGKNGADSSTSCLILTAKTKLGQSDTGVLCTVVSVASKTGAKATLSRNGHTVATGTERKGSKLKLVLKKGSKLKAGKYRLTRSYKQAGRTVTERREVTVS
jgi:hypothetical protein